jgi:alpha-ketoglutaric semialdehyde dehydrogenase
MYNDTSLEEIEKIIQQAWLAFMEYKTMPLQKRALFMKAIANELLHAGDNLILTAIQETNLPIERLKAEKNRTIYQLNSYAEACINGSWLNASINFPNSSNSLKSDIRKTMIPLGPVVIYGASNFPFAYSTAGGDTACAFAAGCVVIVKAHPAHERTSTLVAELIQKAASKCNMPKAIFNHVYGKSFEVGRALIKHKLVKAVGFTGSFTVGKQLLDWANEREEPIPVFAEMGSINPIFILPNKLEQDIQKLAAMLAISITQNAGQFCTKPGVIISIEGVCASRARPLAAQRRAPSRSPPAPARRSTSGPPPAPGAG